MEDLEEYVRYESGVKADFFSEDESYEALVGGKFPDEGRSDEDIVEGIKNQLQNVYDPEIPVDIYNLGLIYDISINTNKDVVILMTLTSPACPVAEDLPIDVAEKASLVKGVNRVAVKITWEVPWNMDMMTEEARLELNLF